MLERSGNPPGRAEYRIDNSKVCGIGNLRFKPASVCNDLAALKGYK